jgi:hypothetical protein
VQPDAAYCVQFVLPDTVPASATETAPSFAVPVNASDCEKVRLLVLAVPDPVVYVTSNEYVTPLDTVVIVHDWLGASVALLPDVSKVTEHPTPPSPLVPASDVPSRTVTESPLLMSRSSVDVVVFATGASFFGDVNV